MPALMFHGGDKVAGFGSNPRVSEPRKNVRSLLENRPSPGLERAVS